MASKIKTALLTAVALTLSANASAESFSLDGDWKLDFWEQKKEAATSPSGMKGIKFQTITASVPGNVELDLLKAGIIENPETGSNVYKLRPYEGFQWRYSRRFPTPEHKEDSDLKLRFGGIDCYSEIYLNGKHIGSTNNMLIEYSFDVKDALKPIGKDNLLEIYIRSSVIEGRKNIPPTISYNFAQMESVHSRRAPHTYGWDIMPRLVSAGLWRSVSLEIENPVHILDAHWFTTEVNVAAKTAAVFLDYTITLPVKYQDTKIKAEFSLTLKGKEKARYIAPVTSHAARHIMGLNDVDFWWPRGYGEPALYDAVLRIIDENGNELDSDKKRIGIRTVKLEMTPMNSEASPGQFCFVVNGERIFVHGSNWTPMDAFHSRDPIHLEKTLAFAEDLNCNMLRCWGGNVYEDRRFFELCDEKGIMVWQDFAMGCTQYPQGLDFQKAVSEEVRSVVLKLRSHPSIALWSGNNENDQNLTIGTLRPLRIDPNDDIISRVTIPSVLFETDPSRTYLPSSPYWSKELCEGPYSTDYLPEDHLWGPRGYYKAPYYTQAKCLFVSEIGYHGMPCRESLEKMFPPHSVYPWSDVKERRWNEDWLTKAVRIFEASGYTPDRNNLMLNQVNLLFGNIPEDLDDFIFASQSVQAEAMKFFIEMFRSQKFAPKTGILWWNIRDGWPIISDAVVDWYNKPKMAYYFIKNVQKDVCLMIGDPAQGAHPLVAVNDTRVPASGKVTVTDIESGRTVFKGEFNVEANGRSLVASLPQIQGQGILKISYTINGKAESENHYLYGRPPFNFKKYKDLLKKTEIFKL